MSRKAQTQSSALAAARVRRQRLDVERDEEDRRIEAATAVSIVALADVGTRRQELQRAESDLATAIEGMLALGITVERAADLLEMSEVELKRAARPIGKGRIEAHTSRHRAATARKTHAVSNP